MKKFFKWLGIVLGGLVGLVVIVFLGLAAKGNASFTRKYDIQVENITIPTDSESIARGEKWVHTDCVGCHGEDLSGGNFFEAPFGYIDAKNLTPGKGGAGSEFTNADWVRAIRHGVNPDGHTLLIMPAPVFWHFSDEDLGSIIAYLKTLPPVDKETREPNINLVGKAMAGAGVFGNSVFVAENIQHDARPTIPPAGMTVEYGE
jgi:mono/diheme cytochrome c family protein